METSTSLIDDERGEPSYQDEFVHVATTLGAKHKLAFNAIGFGDDITLTPSNSSGDREQGFRPIRRIDSSGSRSTANGARACPAARCSIRSSFDTDRHGDVADLSELVGVADDRRSLDEQRQ